MYEILHRTKISLYKTTMRTLLSISLIFIFFSAAAYAAPQKNFVIEYKEIPANSISSKAVTTPPVISSVKTPKKEIENNTRSITYDPNSKEYPVIQLSLNHTTILRFYHEITKNIPGNRDLIYSDIIANKMLLVKPKDIGTRTDIKVILEKRYLLNFEFDITDDPEKGDRIVYVKTPYID